ncbi:MAG: PAS domain S-box protein [Thermoplasmatota archaeon]
MLERIFKENNNYELNNKNKNLTKDIENITEAYKTIFENYQIAITLADRNEQIISWNKYTEDLLNMKEQDLYKKPVRLLYPPEEWEKIRAENVRKKGIKYRMQTQILKKNNEIFDVELSLCILKGEGGNAVGSIGIIKDITALKETEKKLKESENKYKLIFENSAVAITLTDENENIISWNSYAEKLFGTKKDELFRKPVSSLYPIEEWQKIRKQNIRQKGMQHHLETKIITKNKELLDVDISLSVLKDKTGNIVGSIGVIRDISDRKKIERLLKSVMQNAGDSIYLIDKNYRYILANNELLKRFNKTKETLIGKTISELYPLNEAKEFVNKIDQVFKTGKIIKDEHKKNNRCFLRTISPIQDTLTNQTTAVLIISKDITEIKKTQEIVLENEKKYRSIFEFSPESIIIIDKNGLVQDVNGRFYNWLGYKKEDIIGKEFVTIPIFSKQHHDKIKNIYSKRVENSEIPSYELEFVTKNGDKKFGLVQSNIVKDEHTQFDSELMVISDITDRKRMENALKQSEQKFRLVLENSIDMIYQINIKKGTYEYVSPSSKKVLGYTPEEIHKFGIAKMIRLIHPDESPSINKINKDITQNKKDKESIQSLEYRFNHKKIGYRWISDIRSIIYNQNNEPESIIGTIKDITDRKKVWDEMVKSEEKYRVLAETSADGVFTTDVLGRLTYVNPSLEKLMGRRKSQILATPFKNYLSESSVYQFQQIITDIRKKNEKMENVELSLIHQDGYIIPIETNIAPLKKDDTFVGIECTVRDISERESIVRELKKSEKLRTEFMNIAAHELKSPVTPIKGYLELIESDKTVDEKIKKWARIGLRNADRLLLLVNDILDVSRLDTDTMRFNMEKIDTVQILENALEDIQPIIQHKKLKLIKKFPDTLPKIFADKYRLSQVLKNLLGNAVKFTDYGSITLKAWHKDNSLFISIEDTGIGISNSELEKIFTKLYQAYTGEDRKNEGAGLGLYICKEIIQKHRGKIWAASQIGKGSIFTIQLPS